MQYNLDQTWGYHHKDWKNKDGSPYVSVNELLVDQEANDISLCQHCGLPKDMELLKDFKESLPMLRGPIRIGKRSGIMPDDRPPEYDLGDFFSSLWKQIRR